MQDKDIKGQQGWNMHHDDDDSCGNENCDFGCAVMVVIFMMLMIVITMVWPWHLW